MPSLGRKSEYSSELIQQILTLHKQKLAPSEISKKLNLNLRANKVANLIQYWKDKIQIPLSKQEDKINQPLDIQKEEEKPAVQESIETEKKN